MHSDHRLWKYSESTICTKIMQYSPGYTQNSLTSNAKYVWSHWEHHLYLVTQTYNSKLTTHCADAWSSNGLEYLINRAVEHEYLRFYQCTGHIRLRVTSVILLETCVSTHRIQTHFYKFRLVELQEWPLTDNILSFNGQCNLVCVYLLTWIQRNKSIRHYWLLMPTQRKKGHSAQSIESQPSSSPWWPLSSNFVFKIK